MRKVPRFRGAATFLLGFLLLRLLLLRPGVERCGRSRTADDAGEAERNRAGGCRTDAAEANRRLADLAPCGDILLVAGAFDFTVLDCRKRHLPELHGVDDFGRFD